MFALQLASCTAYACVNKNCLEVPFVTRQQPCCTGPVQVIFSAKYCSDDGKAHMACKRDGIKAAGLRQEYEQRRRPLFHVCAPIMGVTSSSLRERLW
jgi:hypothetical protein